jgi:hypothetical protein
MWHLVDWLRCPLCFTLYGSSFIMAFFNFTQIITVAFMSLPIHIFFEYCCQRRRCALTTSAAQMSIDAVHLVPDLLAIAAKPDVDAAPAEQARIAARQHAYTDSWMEALKDPKQIGAWLSWFVPEKLEYIECGAFSRSSFCFRFRCHFRSFLSSPSPSLPPRISSHAFPSLHFPLPS